MCCGLPLPGAHRRGPRPLDLAGDLHAAEGGVGCQSGASAARTAAWRKHMKSDARPRVAVAAVLAAGPVLALVLTRQGATDVVGAAGQPGVAPRSLLALDRGCSPSSGLPLVKPLLCGRCMSWASASDSGHSQSMQESDCRIACSRDYYDWTRACSTGQLVPCIEAGAKYGRCCSGECSKPGRGRSKRSKDSCSYGDANICCSFRAPDIMVIERFPFAYLRHCNCCWKLDCVCCKTPDSDGAMCMRDCLQCWKSSPSGASIEAHETCMKKCRDEEKRWTGPDEDQFIRAAGDCLVCDDPWCATLMKAAVGAREYLTGVSDCRYSPYASGLSKWAPGCSDADRNR